MTSWLAPQENTTSPYLFASIALFFCAPLIQASLQRDQYWFSDAQVRYIHQYIKRGYVTIGIAGAGLMTWLGGWLFFPPLYAYVSLFFLLSALHITRRIAHIFVDADRARLTSPAAVIDKSAWLSRFSLAQVLAAYLPWRNVRMRYKEKKQHLVMHKEGRLLWTLWILAAFVAHYPLLLIVGAAGIVGRMGFVIVQWYRPLSWLRPLLSGYRLEPEELRSYITCFLIHGRTRMGLERGVRERIRAFTRGLYEHLPRWWARRAFCVLIWVGLLAFLGSVVDTWWMWTALGIIYWRYIMIAFHRHRAPFLPVAEETILLAQPLPHETN